jgi:hypothetical protein
MTEELNLDGEFDTPIQWNDDVVETNEVTPEDEDQFVKSIIGETNYPTARSEGPTPTRESDEVSDSQATLQQIHDKYNEPAVTKGGKKIRIVKDEWGTFWHVEFMSGGQLPLSLSGQFTSAESANAAVQVYVNSQV